MEEAFLLGKGLIADGALQSLGRDATRGADTCSHIGQLEWGEQVLNGNLCDVRRSKSYSFGTHAFLES